MQTIEERLDQLEKRNKRLPAALTLMAVAICASLQRRLRACLGIIGNNLLLFALLGCAQQADYEKQYKWGFRNIQNEVIIDFHYDSVFPFSQGLAAFYNEGDSWGYIDKTGALKIPMQHDEARPFGEEGLARIRPRGDLEKKRREREVHYIDRSGGTVLSLKADRADDFYNGVAWVRKYIGTRSHRTSTSSPTPMFSWGLIDKDGNFLVPHIEDIKDERRIWMPGMWSEGLSVIRRDRAGYMNTAGEIVIPCQYEYAEAFSNGLAFVKSENERWSVIDKKGRIRISELAGGLKFKPIGVGFKSFLAPVKMTRGKSNYLGYIDRKGKFAFKTKGMQLRRLSSFRQGLAHVAVQSEDKIGFIDRKGTWAIRPAFSEAGHFHVVNRAEGSDRKKTVAWAIPWAPYDFWDGLRDFGWSLMGMYQKTTQQKFGYIDRTGDWLIEPETTIVYNFRKNRERSLSAIDRQLYRFSEGLVAFPSIKR